MLATSLASKNPPSEADFRSAVSRSYYWLFHVARKRLIEINKLDVLTTDGVHRKVQTEIMNLKRSLGEQYGKVKKLRENADYRKISCDEPYEFDISSDWQVNWQVSQTIINRILPSITSLKTSSPAR